MQSTEVTQGKVNVLLGRSLVEVDLDLVQLGLGLTDETAVEKKCWYQHRFALD